MRPHLAPVGDNLSCVLICSTFILGLVRHVLDYVTRRFNASLAGLKRPWGWILRWAAALRDLQVQLEPRVSRSKAAVQSAS
jgi:hypothetical protein